MKHYLFSLLLLVAAFGVVVPTSVLAQEANQEDAPEEISAPELVANAGKDRNVAIGRTVLFDASNSKGIEQADSITYSWDFGDGTFGSGIDATHEYTQSGTYRATLTITRVIDGERTTSESDVIVSVQDKLVLLISDQSVSDEQVLELQERGLTQGALVIPIRDTGVDQEYLTVQQLSRQMLEREEDLAASSMIITWTDGGAGLNAIIGFARDAALNNQDLDQYGFNSKAIVAVANSQTLGASARLAQTAFASIQPRYIVVSDENILNDAIANADPEALESALPRVSAPYQIVTPYTERGLEQLGPLNFMSFAVNYMINRGVPTNSLFLILMLPVMATIIAAARQVGGIKAFGIFAPTVIALSFLATGLKFGVAVFVSIIVIGTIARMLARKLRIAYLPRMATVLTILALAVFGMFLLGAYFDQTGFVAISIFPILIMTVLTEHFVSVQISQGFSTAIKLTLETLALSVIGYWVADWTWFKSLVLAYPEIILLTFVINYIMGKFTGLRVSEYVRFRSVLKKSKNVQGSK